MPHRKGFLQAFPLNLPHVWRLESNARSVIHLASHFGVNLTRLAPGAWSMVHHRHKRQDEFIYVSEGEPVLVTDAGETQLSPGMCVRASQPVARRITWRTVVTATVSSWRWVTEAGMRKCYSPMMMCMLSWGQKVTGTLLG